MTVGTRFDPGEVDTRVTTLSIDVAGEVPVQVTIGTGDGRVCRLGDVAATVLVDVLEKEGYIVPGGIPTTLEQRVLASGPRSHGRVVKVGEVVVVTMDDNRGGLDFSGVVTIRGRPTNGKCETEGKETDAGHEGEDDAKETDLLPPCPLLLRCSDAASSEQRRRDTASDGKAVKEPAIFRARADGVQPLALLLRGLWVGTRTRC